MPSEPPRHPTRTRFFAPANLPRRRLSPGDTTATVTVTAPTSGGAASSYTVTANPGGASCEITLPADPLSCQVTGLSNGTEYTFTAVGDNDGGTSNTSDDSDSVTPLAPAPSITFDDVHLTADGFTAQIRDFQRFNWSSSSVTPGNIVVSDTGLVTVTNVPANTYALATIRTTRFGFVDGSATVDATSLMAGLIPSVGDSHPTADGFTAQIGNYLTNGNNTNYEWIRVSDHGAVDISESGLLTVTNADPSTPNRCHADDPTCGIRRRRIPRDGNVTQSGLGAGV